MGTGYAESKWVSEQILLTAAEKTPLDPLIARLGQICGGPDGTWNAHEWFPSMVQSAIALGCFPDDPNVSTNPSASRPQTTDTYCDISSWTGSRSISQLAR